jgi:hypothetical protein
MATTTKLTILKDVNGNVLYSIPFSNKNYSTSLSANVAQSLAVPGDAQIAVFSFSGGSDVWVNNTTTAALPGGAFSSSANVLNPVIRPVVGDSTLSFISGGSATVNVSFYTLLSTGLA